MEKQLCLSLSNQLELLYEELKFNLFAKSSNPMQRRLVVVYGPAMKSWLMVRMAQDPELGIAAGIEFLTLTQAFTSLTTLFNQGTEKKLPSRLELGLAIERELYLMIESYFSLSPQEKKIWEPLLNYLGIEKKAHLTRKNQKRVIALSRKLAELFRDYGRFAPLLIEEWSLLEEKAWQEALWLRLFRSQPDWSYPAKALEELPLPHPTIKPNALSIHFFSLSFLTKSEFSFIVRAAKSYPVYYYLLSPCALFWSDIRSDRESAWLHKFWKKRVGESSLQLDQLDLLLRNRNPLLANFGKVGREMALQIEESHLETKAYYLLSSHVMPLTPEAEAIETLYLAENSPSLTLLQALQADLLLMRNPEGSPSFSFEEEDFSIQLHGAPTARRELEVLYHQLVTLFKNNSALTPSDVIVMAPKIGDYLPFIHAVFGKQESLFDYQILDLGLEGKNEITTAFLNLLALSEGRWDRESILQLFAHPDFQRRNQFSRSDYEQIKEWIDEAGIIWGKDNHHQEKILERNHCQNKMVEEGASGTWQNGFDRLIKRLTQALDSETDQGIDFSDSELMGRWMQNLQSLYRDLKPLHDSLKMSVDGWINHLLYLLERYFSLDFNSHQSKEDYATLRAHLETLRQASQCCAEIHFPFESIKTDFLELLDQPTITYREDRLQSIRFCSLIPLRSIPSKIIAMIGMDEESFPRIEKSSSLNLMSKKERESYAPTSNEYDRYLFLETLHSARETLIFTYRSYNQDERKELAPSILVEELFSYLERFYKIKGESISKKNIFKHPFDSFDKLYFVKNSPFVNECLEDFKIALLLQAKEKKASRGLVAHFSLSNKTPSPPPPLIHLKELRQIARNPIKFHLNRRLEIFLEKPEDRQQKKSEDKVIHPLQKYLMKEASLKQNPERLMKQAEREGKLPFGMLKQVAAYTLKEEFESVQERLKKHEIDSSELFDIEFLNGIESPTQIEPKKWLFPPFLSMREGEEIALVGTIKHVSQKGLFILGKDTLSEAWKAWPDFLLYMHAVKVAPTLLSPCLILGHGQKRKEAFFTDPTPFLEEYLDYYFLCLQTFSPLLPDWIPLIYQANEEGMKKKLEDLFSHFSPYGQYEEAAWILHKRLLPCEKALVREWNPELKKLATKMIDSWYPKLSRASEEHEAL